MDKVQFNTQMVNMRKTVKRAKVQLIHHLTRQIAVFRKKKGSGRQLMKNERRAGRLVKEVEAIKDLPLDEITMSAIINKNSLESVLGKATSTSEERAMARLVHHKLISQGVASFKDLVTDDLLAVGKKKEKMMQMDANARKRRGSESSSVDSNSEKDYDDDRNSSDDGDNDNGFSGSEGNKLFNRRRVSQIGNSDDDVSEVEFGEATTEKSGRLTESMLSHQTQKLRQQMNLRHEQKKSDLFLMGAEDEDDRKEEDKRFPSEHDLEKKSSRLKSKESGLLSLTKEQTKARPKKKSDFFIFDRKDEGSSEDEQAEEGSDEEEMIVGEEEDDDEAEEEEEEIGKMFDAEFRELSAELKKDRHQGKSGPEQQRKFRSLDSMFVEKLSSNIPTLMQSARLKGQKNRPGQAKRQIINKKRRLEELRRPSSQTQPTSGSRHIALVDMPSLQQQDKGREKLPSRIIPGINAPIHQPRTDVTSDKLLPSQRPLIAPLSRRERREGKVKQGAEKGTAISGRGGRGRGGGGRGGRGLGVMRGSSGGQPESLHPSWEAKRKKKEQESKIVPFLGKKVTFDD